jgi:uncharacterized repeat protein (TIGR02543 family)
VQGSGGGWTNFGTNGGNNIDIDPLFVSPIAASSAPTAAGNYRLTATSPAKDTGSNALTLATTDSDGNPRVVDTSIDMGAYEYQHPTPDGGGGIYNYNYGSSPSSPTLTNVTVSGNTAINGNGGGIYGEVGTVTLKNSIVAGNPASDAPDCWVENDGYTSFNASYSLIGNTAHTMGTDVTQGIACIVDTDPKFVQWINPAGGGWTPTTLGDYRLSVTGAISPAIDAGNKDDYPGGDAALVTATDLAGNPCLSGANIDMGAYEVFFYQATFRFGSPRLDSIAAVVPSGALTEPSPAPNRTNYTFGGWYSEAGFGTPFNYANPITQDTALYAKWRAKVTFDATPGSITPTDTVVDLNQTVSSWAHVPTRAGYTFSGWYTDNSTFANGWILATTQATRDTTLYAKWTLSSYTVTFEREPGITRRNR